MTNQHEKITKRVESQNSVWSEIEKARRLGLVCPNCGGALEGRKCKLVCQRRGCGYVVTCSEW